MVVEFASFAWSLKIEVASRFFSLFFCANFLLDFRWIRNMVSVVYCQVLFIEGKGKLRVISWKCRFPLGACYLFGFSRSSCRPCIELLWIYNQVVTIMRNMKWYRIFSANCWIRFAFEWQICLTSIEYTLVLAPTVLHSNLPNCNQDSNEINAG